MYLLKLYSDPPGLFESVTFKNGVNFIYGKKDVDNPRLSLNSIGKSTFLDLLDFCLLSSYQKNHSPRLFAANDIIDDYNIILEFRISGKIYKIKRNVNSPKEVFFGINNEFRKHDIEKLREFLAKKIFQRDDYPGKFNADWYRSLMNFYLKIQKFKKEQFSDPIKYMRDVTENEINIYQLYLLGLDNTFAYSNLQARTDLKRIAPAANEVERLIKEKFNIKKINDTNSNIAQLKYDIKKLENAIETFELKDEYEDAENKANKLTQEIKNKWLQNFSDKKKLESYEDSFKTTERISITRIENLYEELSQELASFVKKTLDEAIAFRKKLSASRKDFLKDEIKIINENIKTRDEEIQKLEQDRAKLFNFLSTQDAIKDLTEAFSIVSEKRNQLADLEGNTRILNELLKEKGEIERTLKSIENDIRMYVFELRNEVATLYEQFMQVYNAIYFENQDKASFNIVFNKRKDRKLDINISMPDMYGRGKNQGRTLVYDLFVLINSFRFPNNFPKFLVHDGIFDNMDKTHFIAAYEFIQEVATTHEMQYITTLNEEGTLSDKFGNADKVTPAKIESEAVLVLTPTSKLFGRDFQSSE